MQRVVTPELLDEDLGTPEEIRSTLLDLRGFNRNFGGFRSITSLLKNVARKNRLQSLSFLDVAGGTGDVAAFVQLALRKEGLLVKATVLDRAVSHMTGNDAGLGRVAGDALRLPFASRSFDIVGCNLFCHHLESAEVVSFFDEALRVARHAVIVSDLRRNLFHWIVASAGRFTYRSRLTRNDAPASVRRAYTPSEIAELARKSVAASFDLWPHYFQRFGLILWKA
jgi:ubiquinone/menaquinone biosynthesis C-methylase UbiE